MKTRKDLFQEISKEFGIPVEQAEKEVEGYWRKVVRDSLNSGEYHTVKVPFIGKFYTSPKKLMKQIAYYLDGLKKIRAGILKNKPLFEKEAREMFPRLWKMKQRTGWHLTPTAKSLPKIPRHVESIQTNQPTN